MKLYLAALAACPLTCALTLSAQNYPSGELKHLSVPTLTSVRPVRVTALQVERQGEYPAILHLKGSVEIKTPVCLVSGVKNEQICGGYLVFHADEADFHEDSGQIEAKGNVSLTREK